MLLVHFRKDNAPPVLQHWQLAASAKKMRFVFYNFKKALEIAGRHDDLAVANSIVAKVAEDAYGGADLEFSLRDNADFALDLEAAIRRASEAEQEEKPQANETATGSGDPVEDLIAREYFGGGGKRKGSEK
jgi:hypothetical protein